MPYKERPILHRIQHNAIPINKPKTKPSAKASLHLMPLPIESIKDVGIGKQLNILACGPSINELDLSKLEGDVMCINKPIMTVNPKYWLFLDNSQMTRNQDTFDKYEGIIINSYNVRGRRSNQILLEQARIESFCIDGKIWPGKSSTYAACQISMYMNYDKVKVYGLDMGAVNGRLWHYGTNPDASPEYRIPRFEQEVYAWQWAADHLPKVIRARFEFMSPYNTRHFLDVWRGP